MSYGIAIPFTSYRRLGRLRVPTSVRSNIRAGAVVGLAAVMLAATGTAQPVAARTEAEAVIHEACGDAPEAGCVAELRKVCHRKMTMRCYFSRKERIDVKRADRARPDDGMDPFGEIGTDYAE